jgi:hypothetical protein
MVQDGDHYSGRTGLTIFENRSSECHQGMHLGPIVHERRLVKMVLCLTLLAGGNDPGRITNPVNGPGGDDSKAHWAFINGKPPFITTGLSSPPTTGCWENGAYGRRGGDVCRPGVNLFRFSAPTSALFSGRREGLSFFPLVCGAAMVLSGVSIIMSSACDDEG